MPWTQLFILQYYYSTGTFIFFLFILGGLISDHCSPSGPSFELEEDKEEILVLKVGGTTLDNYLGETHTIK